jgi:glycosyltransferase involved in cell wall biosynthesis
MDDKVHFLGSQPHEEIWILLRSSAVVCVPSIIDSRGETEGMPTVVLEAMAAGARVVGSEVDGIPDILKDAENGWLAQPADSDDLARALLDALEHPVGDDIADAGEQTALLHEWHRVAEEYALVLDEAIHD